VQFADSGKLGMAEQKHEITQRHVPAETLTIVWIRSVDAGPDVLLMPED
jgi:hypothetical protein